MAGRIRESMQGTATILGIGVAALILAIETTVVLFLFL
jgi:hypothetical protein